MAFHVKDLSSMKGEGAHLDCGGNNLVSHYLRSYDTMILATQLTEQPGAAWTVRSGYHGGT